MSEGKLHFCQPCIDGDGPCRLVCRTCDKACECGCRNQGDD